MRKRKSFYVLIELLVALTLVAFAAPFFVSAPIHVADQELTLLDQLELQRIADVAYADFRAEVAGMKKVDAKELKKSSGGGREIVLSYGSEIKHTYAQKREVKIAQQKKGKALEEYSKIRMKVSFASKRKAKKKFVYTYFWFVEKKPGEIDAPKV
jgi:tRNA G10  N-methylase Trm11